MTLPTPVPQNRKVAVRVAEFSAVSKSYPVYTRPADRLRELLTLNQLTQLSGGQAMPDSLVGGFDPGFVEQLRAAMDADARGQLNYVHKTAGMLFPLIFGFTWLLLIGTNVARKSLRWALWSLPLLFAAVRLWGNTVIDEMMSADTLDGGQVALASGLTVAGWVLLALSVVAGVAAVLLGRKAAAASPTPGHVQS